MVQLDDNDQLASCFWCDGRSSNDYEIFNDVSCFDTTFKTNGYNLPHAPFVGVNHHGQPISFCYGLILAKLLNPLFGFQAFFKAMNGKQPNTIFIVQSQEITNAITTVFHDSHHRLCLWYIFKNACKNLSHVYDSYFNFSKDFRHCIYHNESGEEFEKCCDALIIAYNLGVL